MSISVKCKYCGGSHIVRNGKVNSGNQRYKCRDCKRNFTVTKRKYSPEFKLDVIKWYLEGVGIRSIERRMNVSARVIVYWIRQFASIVREKLSDTKIPKDLKDIQVMEIDELVTYVKKNREETKKQEKLLKENTPGYGLLLIDDTIKFLILK